MRNLYANTNKIAISLTALAIISCSILWNEKSRAATSSLSGKCGGVFALRTVADGPMINGQQSSQTVSLILNFDTLKASIAVTQKKYIANGTDLWSQSMDVNKNFTLINDPDGLEGSYEVVVDSPNSDNIRPKFRLIPVNAGNTMLIQGKSFGSNGVCQKI